MNCDLTVHIHECKCITQAPGFELYLLLNADQPIVLYTKVSIVRYQMHFAFMKSYVCN